jgi:NTP pyrophosphatase (non-canonical NTP hydrolase)
MHSNNTVNKIALNKRMNDQSQEVLEIYGQDVQANIICEELSELLTALFHYDRGKISKEDLISEIADCEMQLTTLKYIICESSEEYEQVLHKKLAKQRKYIDCPTPWNNNL